MQRTQSEQFDADQDRFERKERERFWGTVAILVLFLLILATFTVTSWL